MSIYSEMPVFTMSNVARLKAGVNPETNLKELPFDLRLIYPFYKLSFGQSLAFDLNTYNVKSIRSTVSQYNKRHLCRLVCITHNGILEVARIG